MALPGQLALSGQRGGAVRRAAGDLRPCPARAGGSILRAGREVSSQANLTAASRRKVGRLHRPWSAARDDAGCESTAQAVIHLTGDRLIPAGGVVR